MRVEALSCIDFRNLSHTSIEPFEEMNVICGENAQGKTNLIEAIWLFTGAKSFRASKDSSYISFNKNEAKCELNFISAGVKNNAVMKFGEKRSAFLNDKPLSNPSRLAGSFNAIVFSPSDLSLIKDGPAMRRRFLDIAIGQLYPNYIEILKAYTRAVSQRNKIIKDYKYDASLAVMLDVFEAEIAEMGAKIIKYRREYISETEKYVPDIYSGLSGGKERIESLYVSLCEGEELLTRLRQNRKEDMFSGVTSVGPHRDDLEFKINGIDARIYGSQGQKRSAALSLKLAQAEIIKSITGEYPVCLLDDVMSELDQNRQNYIFNHIKGWQSFITCCDPSSVERLKEGKIFTVKAGEVI